MDRVSLFCILASYAVAFVLDVAHQRRPYPILRLLALGFGSAGLLAHSIYLAVWRPPLAYPFGWLLLVAWILAIFHLYGSVHHRHKAWGVFVLPLMLILVGIAALYGPPVVDGQRLEGLLSESDISMWAYAHVALLFLGSVGMCVGCVASVMYLVQARQLKAKLPPDQSLPLLSLERLEEMNRRAIGLAFVLLAAGTLIGLMLMSRVEVSGWADPRVISSGALAAMLAFVAYLHYARHVRGRRLAQLTILAFLLVLGWLILPHTLLAGGPR